MRALAALALLAACEVSDLPVVEGWRYECQTEWSCTGEPHPGPTGAFCGDSRSDAEEHAEDDCREILERVSPIYCPVSTRYCAASCRREGLLCR